MYLCNYNVWQIISSVPCLVMLCVAFHFLICKAFCGHDFEGFWATFCLKNFSIRFTLRSVNKKCYYGQCGQWSFFAYKEIHCCFSGYELWGCDFTSSMNVWPFLNNYHYQNHRNTVSFAYLFFRQEGTAKNEHVDFERKFLLVYLIVPP